MGGGEHLRDVSVGDDGTVSGQRSYGDGHWTQFTARLRLLWIRWACDVSDQAAAELWAMQDGYGQRGFTPAQGWDWSGIRDSSGPAVADMFAYAQQVLPAAQVAARLAVSVDRLEEVASHRGDG